MLHGLALECMRDVPEQSARGGSTWAQMLSQVGTLDEVGRIRINEKALRRALKGSSRAGYVKHDFQDLLKLAHDGCAVFEGHSSVLNPKVLVPWRTLGYCLEHSIHSRAIPSVALKGLAVGFGVESGAAPERIRQILRGWPGKAPGYMLRRSHLECLAVLAELPEEVGVSGRLEVLARARWHLRWWGWELELEQADSNQLADALGAATTSWHPIVPSGSLSSLFATVSFWMSLQGMMLAASIRAANGPAGIRIHGTWPTSWLGTFMWAEKRQENPDSL